MNIDDESIDLACNALTAATKKYCKRRKIKFSHTLNEILQHARHILVQLTNKQKSLQHGLTALKQCWQTWMSQLSSSSNNMDIAQLLTRFFHNYLRLRDGMNLQTSGECRHAGDVHQAKQQPLHLKSRLNLQDNCKDGYTRLFSAQYYSGYGWDEFYDPNVGVLQRLKQALGGKNNECWDTLVNYGAQAFESCMDQHEIKCREIQYEFEQLRQLVIRDASRFCTNVTMTTLDKMESLVLTNANKVISLQRRANAFQVHDCKGCLPNGWQVQDWKRAMEYKKQQPPSSNKKRRIILDDDSLDEDKSINKKKPTTTNGLCVHVKEPKEKKSAHQVSLRQLKEEYNVNAQEWEQSRDVLEAEAVGKEAMTIDETSQLVADSTSKVERMKRVVARVQKRQDEFDEELWDARECLREASMTLGSNLLSLSHAADKDDENKNLLHARQCFQEALDLVKKQESVHQAICEQTNDDSPGARTIRRKLLLLRGRAHVNFGITLVQLGLAKCPETVKKSLAQDALAQLESAEGCADSIRARAVADEAKGASPSQLAIDRLEADQLEALVNRWLSNSLWYKRKRKEAVAASEKGSRFLVDRQHDTVDEDLLEAETELGIECFYVCTSLADLALDALEKHQIVAEGHPKRRECLAKGEELFSIALQAYKRAGSISTNMHKLTKDASVSALTEDTLGSNGILTAQEIEKNLTQIKAWWEEKKLGNVILPKDGTKQDGVDQRRNDLFSSGPLGPHQGNTPVKRFTVNESSSRRRASKRQKHQGGSGFSRSVASTSTGGGNASSKMSSSIRYQKWGDELAFPQVKSDSGEMVPLLAYPACAPELPPGFTPFKPNQ